MKRRLMAFGNVAVFFLLVVSLVGCGGTSPTSLPVRTGGPSGGSGTGDTHSDAPASGDDKWGITSGKDATGSLPESQPRLAPPPVDGSGSVAAAPTSTTASASGETPLLNVGGADSLSEAPSSKGSDGGLNTGKSYQQYRSDLTAGQVDDNAKFADYMDYQRGYTADNVNRIDVSQRLFVRVMDGAQKPVAGARVQLFDGDHQVFEGSTVSDGRVLFFPSAADEMQATRFRAVITRGQTSVEATVKPGGQEQVVTLSGLKDNSGDVGIDMVFLLDATGSMGDEIEKIKATVGSIAQRIEQLPGSATPRFGLVAFRDRGDVYVTRSWQFTPDIQQFSDNLSNVYAAGGGDTPESVNAGLHDAIHLPGWADNSTGRHLRMIVLVGDAPPHLDYQDDYRYPALLQEAAAAGIKIFPVGASNLESDGEYIFRQFAEVTQGQFVFLTYANGVSGAPGLATDKHVSDFTVQNLDTLIVNLVAGEVANQTGQNVGEAQPQSVPVVAPVQVRENVVVPTPAVTGLAAMLDDFVGGRGGIFWIAMLLLVGAVVLSTSKRVIARVIPEQAQEIYIPESSIDTELIAWPESSKQEGEEQAVLAAHLQPSANPVEVYLDVQPAQQPTVPLR
jgi:hypothetical protein